MRNEALIAAALLAALSVQGCATKELGRQSPLTGFEKDAMSCRDIQLEMSKMVGFVEYINKSYQHQWYDVPAALESRWIGNTNERSAALESANTRMVQLWALHDGKKCGDSAAMPTMGLPVQKPVVEERPAAFAPASNTAPATATATVTPATAAPAPATATTTPASAPAATSTN